MLTFSLVVAADLCVSMSHSAVNEEEVGSVPFRALCVLDGSDACVAAKHGAQQSGLNRRTVRDLRVSRGLMV